MNVELWAALSLSLSAQGRVLHPASLRIPLGGRSSEHLTVPSHPSSELLSHLCCNKTLDFFKFLILYWSIVD